MMIGGMNAGLMLLAVAVVAVADENFEVSELREKVTSLTTELQAKDEPPVPSKAKAGGIHARVTVTAETGMGEDETEGFGSDKKVDLDIDFECPTSNDPDDWIETVEVNTVNNGDNNEDYLSSGETYKPVHFTINQGTDRRRASMGHRRRASDIYYQGNSNKKVGNPPWFPSTLDPMADTNTAGDYFEGRLMRSDKKFCTDEEITQWYKIEDGECYAMAAYVKTRVADPSRFRAGKSDNFLKEAYLRTVKFAVCKNVGGEPQCASRKNIVSCWYKKTNNAWKRCGNGDKLLTAAILARA